MYKLILFLSLFSCACGAQTPTTVLADHHVHLMSPALIALWKDMGIPFSRANAYYSDIDTILNVLGAERISLISMAYVYSSDEFGGQTENAAEKIRAENDFLAKARSRHPERIKAWYGIDPLHPGAMAEVERCHRELQLDGIKLHFSASQVYLTVAAHLARVKEIFQYASGNRIPVLLHFDNWHPKFGRTDVGILADSILAGLSFADVQIAHFGSSGGFNQKTKDVIDRFAELFAAGHPVSKHKITFDVSAVCLDKDSEGTPKLTEREFEELAAYCRKLGFDRIAFGTDYPLYMAPEYLAILKEKLKLSEEEVDRLFQKATPGGAFSSPGGLVVEVWGPSDIDGVLHFFRDHRIVSRFYDEQALEGTWELKDSTVYITFTRRHFRQGLGEPLPLEGPVPGNYIDRYEKYQYLSQEISLEETYDWNEMEKDMQSDSDWYRLVSSDLDESSFSVLIDLQIEYEGHENQH